MRLAIVCFFPALMAAQSWSIQSSGVNASLRAVGVVSAQVAWASGTGGTWLRTDDGGATWTAGKVPGAEKLDFRALHAVDARSAFLMSIGSGPQSRVYRTADAGAHWNLLFTNPDAKGFFDALAFWDARRGILVGDAVEGHIVVFTTADGGGTGRPRPPPPP